MIINRSNIIRAVVILTKKSLQRKNGTVIRFDDNAVVIVNSGDKILIEETRPTSLNKCWILQSILNKKTP